MFKRGHTVNLGRRVDSTTKEKLRLSKLGQKNPRFGKPGIMLGKKHSKESLEKMRAAKLGVKRPWFAGKNHPLFGTHYSPEERLQKSLSSRGPLGNNWRGGITQINKAVRNMFEYRQWVCDVFKRDDYTCIVCGRRGIELNAHHIKAFSVILKENNIRTTDDARACAELWDINNGESLCLECHEKTNNYKGKQR